eukprot:TRINITY_DN1230_c0_g1_i23.p1 TRINITY_DN1230_c0_g1~~TRINITY_DN1230_c0_g1_i23.p1  ORF type:complete len:302 (+),score=24.45 TRINITY_DN1230_c0_g1_i23:924-1829(+)
MYPRYKFNVVSHRDKVSCIIGTNDVDDMLAKTRLLAQSGSKLILWSETAIGTLTTQQTKNLWKTVGGVAREYSVLIGITYLRYVNDSETDNVSESLVWNVFNLVDDTGSVCLNYSKSHPVPVIEGNVEAGKKELPYVDTKYGRIGVAICFDFNYPSFISQAGKKGVDIMLQPSWTWGPLAKYHAKQNAVRSVEHGFHTFRCARLGYSGVFTPIYEPSSFRGIKENGTMTTTLPYVKRTRTLYSFWGDMVSWLCVVFSIFYYILCLPKKWIDPILDRFPQFQIWTPLGDSESTSIPGNLIYY